MHREERELVEPLQVAYTRLSDGLLLKPDRSDNGAAHVSIDIADDGSDAMYEAAWAAEETASEGRSSRRSKSMLERASSMFEGRSSEERIRCLVCFDHIPFSQTVVLSACRHRMCRSCVSTFLEVKIRDGQVFPVCFHQDSGRKSRKCGQRISSVDIEALVSIDVFTKYRTYKFYRENQCGRKCPYCDHSQVCRGADEPEETCQNCHKVFCFLHANAHENRTCGDYERQQLESEQLTLAMLRNIAKNCPKCSSIIEKDGGCNHIKCSRCATNFCWLCSTIVENAEFPSHFQWWNLSGCAGLLQVAIRQETSFERCISRVISLAHFVIVGPIAMVLTLVMTPATCFCLPCTYFFGMSFTDAMLCGVELFSLIMTLPFELLVLIWRSCHSLGRSCQRHNHHDQLTIDAATAA